MISFRKIFKTVAQKFAILCKFSRYKALVHLLLQLLVDSFLISKHACELSTDPRGISTAQFQKTLEELFFSTDMQMNEPALELWIETFDTKGRWQSHENENTTCEEPQSVGNSNTCTEKKRKTIMLLTTSSTWMTKSRNLQSDAEEGWV